MLKFITHVILLLAVAGGMVWHELLIYSIAQGRGQLNIIWHAKPVDEVLTDTTFPDSLKQKLRLIQEIKIFVVDHLGITPSDNYTTLFHQGDKPILLAVTACEPFQFKAKEWHFPILGNVPYKGFFDAEKAREEVRSLKAHGYDVGVYSPSGWSTLGWFTDPILSGMLKKSEGALANLIIHELTHGTLFVKDNVEFNENLANFIGDKGAELFLAHRFGDHSHQLMDYKRKKEDEKLYTEYMLNSVIRLDSLYATFPTEGDEKVKRKKKDEMILQIVKGVLRLNLHKRKNYFEYSLEAIREKNSFFMGFKRYDSQYDVFEEELHERYHDDLLLYLQALKQIHGIN